MKMRFRSSRERFLVSVAVVTTSASLLVRGIPLWSAEFTRAQDAAATIMLEHTHELDRVAKLPLTLDSLDAAVAEFTVLGETLLIAPDQSAAELQLARLMREVAVGADTRILTMDTRSEKGPAHMLVRVTTTLHMQGDVLGLADMLLLVASHPIGIHATSLSIKPVDVDGRPDQPEVLRIELTAQALAHIPERRD
jgi:hypothetical protein